MRLLLKGSKEARMKFRFQGVLQTQLFCETIGLNVRTILLALPLICASLPRNLYLCVARLYVLLFV